MDVRLPALRLPLVPRNPLLQLVVIEDNSSRKLMPSVRNIRIDRHGTMLVQTMGAMASALINYTLQLHSPSIVSNSYRTNYLYMKDSGILKVR